MARRCLRSFPVRRRRPGRRRHRREDLPPPPPAADRRPLPRRPRPPPRAAPGGEEAPAAKTSAPLAAPLTDAGYLAVADRLTVRLGALWNARLERYEAGSGTTTQVNADLLLVHAAAALAGYRGPARDDA